MRRVAFSLSVAALVYLSVLRLAGGMTDQPLELLESPWPKFHHDAQNTGLSPYCSAKTGELKWVYTCGGLCQSSPAIASDGTIYVGSHDAKLHAINPDGTGKWTLGTGDMIWSSPAIAEDGTIYVGSYDDKLYAVNPDGSLKWQYRTGGNISSSPAIGEDGTIYVGAWDNNFYAIEDSVTYGKLKWTYTANGWFAFSSPALGQDGTIYCGSYDDSLHAINPDGTRKFAYATGGNIWSSPAVGPDGTIYVGSYDRKLHAINPDGSGRWTYTTGGYVNSSPAIGSDGTIYVGSNDRKLHAVKADGTGYWIFGTGSTIQCSPAVGSDGIIYVGSFDRILYAINPDGSELWRFSGGSNFVSCPAIGNDGTLYIGCQDRKVYGFYGPPSGLVTGGGWIPGGPFGSGDKRTFGFNAHRQACVVSGQLQFNDHAMGLRVHTESMESLWDSVSVALFGGACRVNRERGYTFECRVEDNGEPGQGVDRFNIEIYGPDGNPYYSAGDLLGGGNIQVHPPETSYAKGAPEPDRQPCNNPTLPLTQREEPLFGGQGLVHNWLNPFFKTTDIRFEMPVSGHATLRIYNTSGRLVATLLDGRLSAGAHKVKWETGRNPSGIYFYRLTTGDLSATRKMLVLK